MPSYRVNCENESCCKPRIYYWSDHSLNLCNGCYTALHVRCDWDHISSEADVKECIETVQTLLGSIQETAKKLTAEAYIKGFTEEFNGYLDLLAQIKEKASVEDLYWYIAWKYN